MRLDKGECSFFSVNSSCSLNTFIELLNLYDSYKEKFTLCRISKFMGNNLL